MHLHGATVTSFVPANGTNVLFVSAEAVFDGITPIRGGTPIVFPQFGAGLEALQEGGGARLPSHGFARRSKWTFRGLEWEDGTDGLRDLGVGAGAEAGGRWSAVFTLSVNDVPESLDLPRNVPHDANLALHVRLGPSSLDTKLRVSNTGAEAFRVQALLHTYYRLDRGGGGMDGGSGIASTGESEGLGGMRYVDQLEGGNGTDDAAPSVTFTRETDRIYITGRTTGGGEVEGVPKVGIVLRGVHGGRMAHITFSSKLVCDIGATGDHTDVQSNPTGSPVGVATGSASSAVAELSQYEQNEPDAGGRTRMWWFGIRGLRSRGG